MVLLNASLLLWRASTLTDPMTVTQQVFTDDLFCPIGSYAKPWGDSANHMDHGVAHLICQSRLSNFFIFSFCYCSRKPSVSPNSGLNKPLLFSHTSLHICLWHPALKGNSQFRGFQIGAKVIVHLKIFHFHFICKGPDKTTLEASFLSATQGRGGKLIFIAQNMEKIKSTLLKKAKVVVGQWIWFTSLKPIKIVSVFIKHLLTFCKKL